MANISGVPDNDTRQNLARTLHSLPCAALSALRCALSSATPSCRRAARPRPPCIRRNIPCASPATCFARVTFFAFFPSPFPHPTAPLPSTYTVCCCPCCALACSRPSKLYAHSVSRSPRLRNMCTQWCCSPTQHHHPLVLNVFANGRSIVSLMRAPRPCSDAPNGVQYSHGVDCMHPAVRLTLTASVQAKGILLNT
jgi:hypothetical protein